MRRSHSEYPASRDKPAFRHDDLMMIYWEGDNKAPEAVYADSEGRVIHYECEVSSDGTIVRFLSRAAPGAPRYRLTYQGSVTRQARCVYVLLDVDGTAKKDRPRLEPSQI
jgi:hypothetical protein